jgi:hypothetical protein
VIGDRVDGFEAQDAVAPALDHAAASRGLPTPAVRWSRRISSPVERYYGRFGLDPTYRRLLHDAGLRIAGVDGRDGDARVMRLADHPFYA